MTLKEILLTAAERVLGCIFQVIFFFRGLIKPREKIIRPKDVVIFHHPGRGPWVPSMIPFAVKLETYLRMAKIPYKSVCGLTKSPGKGKFPWIEYNDKIMGDSSLIVNFLNKEFQVDLNKHLNKEQRATARAFQIMCEDHAYWTGVCYRWWIKLDLRVMTEAMGFPSWLFTWYISRKMQKLAWSQGMGRHSYEEIHEMMVDDLRSMSDIIGNKNFLMGNEPCEEDCAVFGMLSQLRWNMPGTAEEGVRMFEEQYPILRDYCDRMKEKFWPDWEECITHGGKRKPSK